MANDRHAKILSPSASKIWLACPRSARLVKPEDNPGNIYAETGSIGHLLSEYKLKKLLKLRAERPMSALIDEEMENYSDDYSSYCYEQYLKFKKKDENAQIFVERELDLGFIISESFGTADVIIVRKGVLQIIDLKTGHLPVDVNGNSQLMIYAIGALKEFDKDYSIKKVLMTIVQPKLFYLETSTISVAKLKKWGETELRPKAAQAYKGEGEFSPGEHCTYCPIANRCKARAEEKLSIAREEFKNTELMSDEELGKILPKLPEIIAWATDLWDYAQRQAINKNKVWPGLKIVLAKTNRKYTDEKKIAEACNEAGYKDIYKKSLIGITEMERLLGKEQFSKILGPYVEKPLGKKILVLESDNRQAITNAQSEFTTYKEEK